MIMALVLVLAVAGAVLLVSREGWLSRWGLAAPQRIALGALAGALLGLLLVPVLGLVAAVLLFVLSLSALLLIVAAVAVVARLLAGRRP